MLFDDAESFWSIWLSNAFHFVVDKFFSDDINFKMLEYGNKMYQ